MKQLLRDSLNRRWRDTPIPNGVRVSPDERVLTWFEMLHRHGPLPTLFLHAFTEGTHRSLKGSQHRLTRLFHENETPHGGGYLRRPVQQKNTGNHQYHQKVYDLTPASVAALKDEGLWRETVPRRSSSWLHDFMTACVTASIHLSCLKKPDIYQYIFHDEIMDRFGLDASPRFALSYQGAQAVLKPDPFFGIKYLKTNSAIIFATEIDCGSEQVSTTRKSANERKTLEVNLRHYRHFIGGSAYKEHFGKQTALVVLNVFNRLGRMQTVMEIGEDMFENGCAYMLFRYLPNFRRYSFVPPPPLLDLFTEPHARIGKPPFSIAQAR